MSASRLQATIAAILQALVGRRLDYACIYPATVISQASDGSLEVLADDPVVRGSGARAVQVRHGMAGVTQTFAPGARVLLGFAAADPGRPFVLGADRATSGATNTQINAATNVDLGNGPTRGAARLADTVEAGWLRFNPAVPLLEWAPDMAGAPGVWVVVPPAPGAIRLDGTITSASAKVRAE